MEEIFDLNYQQYCVWSWTLFEIPFSEANGGMGHRQFKLPTTLCMEFSIVSLVACIGTMVKEEAHGGDKTSSELFCREQVHQFVFK